MNELLLFLGPEPLHTEVVSIEPTSTYGLKYLKISARVSQREINLLQRTALIGKWEHFTSMPFESTFQGALVTGRVRIVDIWYPTDSRDYVTFSLLTLGPVRIRTTSGASENSYY